MPITTPTYWGEDTEYSAPELIIGRSVGALPNGGWVAFGADPSQNLQELRFFNAIGEQTARLPFFDDFVSTRTIVGGRVVATPDGGFAVLYMDGTDPLNENAYVQRFDANGVKVGSEVVIENGAARIDAIEMAADQNGDLIIAYVTPDGSNDALSIATLRGNTLNTVTGPGGVFQISEISINMLRYGAYAVTYQYAGQSEYQVWSGADTQMIPQTFLQNGQIGNSVSLKNGTFVVVWWETDPASFDTSGAGVFARIYNANGVATSDKFLVNSRTQGNQFTAEVVALSDGGFLVTWSDQSVIPSITRAQRFDAAGAPVGVEFAIDLVGTSTNSVYNPILLEDGRILLQVFQLDSGGYRIGWRIVDPRDTTIEGTHGNDVLTTREGDTLIHGLDGNDTVYGRAGDDTVHGGAGNDTMRGGGGGDHFLGGSGNDVLFAGSGDAVFDGGSGSDSVDFAEIAGVGETVSLAAARTTLRSGALLTMVGVENLYGASGNDLLSGNAAANKLAGRGGADTLFGREGADTLTGGTGADRFRYDSVLDSGTAAGDRDTIADFQQGSDLIDLANLDAASNVAGLQHFTFIGTQAHTGAGATLRFSQSGGNTILYADVDANGTADFSVLLTGVFTLTAADFTTASITTILGTNAGETLTGAPGGKIMIGLGGGDTITGMNGADTIVGGLGADTMSGSLGADRFDFDAVNEIGLDPGARDVIADFQKGVDKIDLSTIDANTTIAGNQAFAFLGTAPLTGAGGTLRHFQSAGTTLVEGDVNADGVADFTLQLTGVYTLAASDFVL